jgi:Tfp pilus assembly protein PilO
MKSPALEKLGYPGVAGLGLLVFSLAFYFGNVAPAHNELTNLQRLQMRLQADATTSDGNLGGRVKLPSLAEAPELLKQLSAVADKHGVVVASTSYQLKEKGGQLRLEVNLPIRTAYPSLRAYLRDALALAAPATITDVTLKRAQASDTALEAQIRLSYSFSGAS